MTLGGVGMNGKLTVVKNPAVDKIEHVFPKFLRTRVEQAAPPLA